VIQKGESIHSFDLNSLVRRTEHTDELKRLLKSADAVLIRKGRSRNWVLTVDIQCLSSLISLIDGANEDSWRWVSTLLNEKKPSWSREQLLEFVRDNRSISLAELVSITDCSRSEARKVLDQLEWE